MLEIDVWPTIARADQGEAADLIGREADALDQLCSQGVMGRRQLEQLLALEQCFPGDGGSVHRRDVEFRFVQVCLRFAAQAA
jgi:hypothetical protein